MTVVPSYDTIASLAQPLHITIEQCDGRMALWSHKTGGRAEFADDSDGREQAIRWINADQKLLDWIASLPVHPFWHTNSNGGKDDYSL